VLTSIEACARTRSGTVATRAQVGRRSDGGLRSPLQQMAAEQCFAASVGHGPGARAHILGQGKTRNKIHDTLRVPIYQCTHSGNSLPLHTLMRW